MSVVQSSSSSSSLSLHTTKEDWSHLAQSFQALDQVKSSIVDLSSRQQIFSWPLLGDVESELSEEKSAPVSESLHKSLHVSQYFLSDADSSRLSDAILLGYTNLLATVLEKQTKDLTSNPKTTQQKDDEDEEEEEEEIQTENTEKVVIGLNTFVFREGIKFYRPLVQLLSVAICLLMKQQQKIRAIFTTMGLETSQIQSELDSSSEGINGLKNEIQLLLKQNFITIPGTSPSERPSSAHPPSSSSNGSDHSNIVTIPKCSLPSAKISQYWRRSQVLDNNREQAVRWLTELETMHKDFETFCDVLIQNISSDTVQQEFLTQQLIDQFSIFQRIPTNPRHSFDNSTHVFSLLSKSSSIAPPSPSSPSTSSSLPSNLSVFLQPPDAPKDPRVNYVLEMCGCSQNASIFESLSVDFDSFAVLSKQLLIDLSIPPSDASTIFSFLQKLHTYPSHLFRDGVNSELIGTFPSSSPSIFFFFFF